MELTNEFAVGIPVDEAWSVLTDVERIAPCLPGATLQEVDGDEYRGVVKVKVGPVTAEYRGKATFVEQDPVARRAVLRAEGREARGQGNAQATVTATLVPSGTSTEVRVVTDLTISGRVAQFGRGVLADVSTRLLGQFATALEATVEAGTGDRGSAGSVSEGAATPASETGAEQRGQARPDGATAPQPDAPTASLNLVEVAGPALAKRILPVAALAVVVWVLWRARRRA